MTNLLSLTLKKKITLHCKLVNDSFYLCSSALPLNNKIADQHNEHNTGKKETQCLHYFSSLLQTYA